MQPHLIGLWQKLEGGAWQNPQQLLEGQERLPQLEGSLKVLDGNHVRDHGCIVVWVEPSPGGNATVVVLQYPVETLYERAGHLSAGDSVIFVQAEFL